MKLLLSAVLAFGCMTFAHAETTSEAAEAKAHDVKRSVKKGGHRVEEAVCAEGDAQCLAKKGNHRAEEGADYVKDKTNEGMEKIDKAGKKH